METQTNITTDDNVQQVDPSSSYSIFLELLFVSLGNSTLVENDVNNTMSYNKENDNQILSYNLGNANQVELNSEDETSKTIELQTRFNRLMGRSPASTRESSPILPVVSSKCSHEKSYL